MQALKSNDSEEPTVAFQKQSKWRLIFILILTILVILCVVFIILFAVEKNARTHAEEKAKKAGEEADKEKVCTSKECVFSAYDFLQQINQSVDPCEDFYQYACGSWIQNNPLKTGETVKDGFSMAREKSNEILKKALESSWINYPKNEAVMKTAKFYNTCIDVDSIEKEGVAPLEKLIKDLGGWHISGQNVTQPLLMRIAKMNRELYKRPLFDVNVFLNPFDSNKHILMFGRASVGMPKAYYVTDTPENLKVRNAYKQYMKDVAKLLGGKNDSDSLMMQVYDFEAKLVGMEKKAMGVYSTAEEHLQGVAAASGFAGLTPTLKQFSIMSNTSLSMMTGFLNEVFKEQKITVTKDELVFVWPPQYFVHLFTVFKSQVATDPKVLDNYAKWMAINQFINASPSKFVEAKERVNQALMGNQMIPRWHNCISNMQRVLKMPLGLLYVDKAFNEESKKTVKGMTSYIRQAFLDNIDGYDMMDSYTKQQTRAKAEAILEAIGYPDYIKDPEKLAHKLKGLQVGNKLFDNVRKMIQFAIQENLKLLRKPVDRETWHLGPSQVDGYYLPPQNRIVFLAGILQPPFYNPIHPMYLTYGAIGMVIGHEIIHAFDNAWRVYDKDGNIDPSLWTQQSSNNFAKRSKCLVEQYSNFELFGTKINGNLTLNENIADNGGIKIAYEGYKAWSKNNGAEGTLPGLGVTADQLFFIGFAQPWCSIFTKKPALTQINSDNHSNAKYRVIGTLQNYQKFAEVFKCKPNTYMNPTKKCKVW